MGVLPEAAAVALAELSEDARYRAQILLGLSRLDLSDRVEALLREFAESGTEAEAATASKALAGYRVVNLGEYQDAWDLLESTEPRSYVLSVRNSAYMFSVGSELAMQLGRTEDVVRMGHKCLELRLEDNDLVSIPDGELKVVDTPEFLRPLIPFAAYQPPGAFSADKTGWFFVTAWWV